MWSLLLQGGPKGKVSSHIVLCIKLASVVGYVHILEGSETNRIGEEASSCLVVSM